MHSISITPAPTRQPQPIPLTPMIIKATPRCQLPPIDIATHLLANPNLSVPREIVHGLLHPGTKGLLAGTSKVGKTWGLLDLAASVATGTPFLKWTTTQGKVLFVNLEIQRAFIKDRVQIIKERKGLENLDNLEIWTLRGQALEFEEVLEEMIKRAKDRKYAVVIVDPVYKAMSGRSENTASGVGIFCQYLEQVAVETGAAVVYCHHFTKGNQANKKAMDRMSGSGVFARDADSIITLTEHAEENCYSVEMTLRNLPPQAPFVVEWKFPLMVVREDLDPKDLKGVDRGEGNGNPDHLLATPPGMAVPEEESSPTSPSPAATFSTALP